MLLDTGQSRFSWMQGEKVAGRDIWSEDKNPETPTMTVNYAFGELWDENVSRSRENWVVEFTNMVSGMKGLQVILPVILKGEFVLLHRVGGQRADILVHST